MDKLVAAQAALATTNSVPVKGKGKGRGGKGKGTKLEDRLRAVENVIVQHERTTHMLEDRCSLVMLVRETIHQQKIQKYRDPPVDKATRSRRRTMRPWTRPKKRTPVGAVSAAFCSRTCSTK